MIKRNPRCTTLERWFDLIQHGSGRESSKSDVLPALHDTEACSSCQFTLEILLQKAYKVTQEQAQGYHSLISEKASAAGNDEYYPAADGQSESSDTLQALYASIDKVSTGKRVTSGLESDVLQNLETISTARWSVRAEIDHELQLIRESEADLERLSDDLQQTLMHSDVAARELNSLTGMVHMLSDITSSTSGGNDSVRDFADGSSIPSLLFTIQKEEMDTSMDMGKFKDEGVDVGKGLMSMNGMRLAYNPIPRLHLNWAEINVAWTVAASALCCLRHLHKLPVTTAVALISPGTSIGDGVDTAGAGMANMSGAAAVWSLTLRPLRNRTLIRIVQFRVPVDKGSHRTRLGLGHDATSNSDNCQYNDKDRCEILHDETICLAGQQPAPPPPSPAAFTSASAASVSGEGSDTSQEAYRRAVYALAAYTLATARDVGRYDEMPPRLVHLDGLLHFVGDESAAPPRTATETALGSKVGLKVSGESGPAQSVCPEDDVTESIGEGVKTLCCLLAVRTRKSSIHYL